MTMSRKSPGDGASRLSLPRDVLITEVGNELVLLNLTTELYFGLDEVGSRMWSALMASVSVDAALSVLQGEFDVDPDVMRADLQALVRALVEQQLLEVS